MTARPAAALFLCALCAVGCRAPADRPGPSEAVARPEIDAPLAAWVDAVGDRALLTAVVQPDAALALLGAVDGRLRAAAPGVAAEVPEPAKALAALVGPLPDWDRSRPVVGAFFEPAVSGPAGAIAPQLPDPLDRERQVPGMRHRLLIPSAAPAKLRGGLQAMLESRGWRAADGAWTIEHRATIRLFAESDRVRLELVTDGPPPADWSAPGGPSARTPAHAGLVAAGGPPARLLVRPWHLRAVFAQHGARAIAEALAAASSEMAPMLASHGMAELMAAEVLMHGQGAEFDDWLISLGGDATALDLRAVATLTAAGRAVLERRGRPQPLAVGEGAVARASMAVDLRAMLDAAAVPEGFDGDGAFGLTRGLNACGLGCPLHALARRPFGLLKAMSVAAAREAPIAAGEVRAPQVAFFGMHGPAPRFAAAWQVPAGADLAPVRAAIAGARTPGLEMWTRPLDGGGQAVIVGLGVKPDAAFAAPVHGAPFASLSVDPSALSGAPPAVELATRLFSGVDGRLDVAGGVLVGQLRLGLDGPPKALPAPPDRPVFGDGPISIGGQGPAALCLRRAAEGASEGLRAAASATLSTRGVLLERALGGIAADLTCAEGDAALRPAARGLRRMLLLPGSLAELRGWDPAGAITRLTPLCAAGDAVVCARLKAVEARPEAALPTWAPIAPSVARCPTPIERGAALRITAAGMWLGDRALPEGEGLSAALKGAGSPVQLGVDPALPWARVEPIVRALIEAGVSDAVLVGRREGRAMAVPVQLRLPPADDSRGDGPGGAFARRAGLPRGVAVSLAADGARIGGESVTREALRLRRIERPDELFDLYPADDLPWQAVAAHALSVCGAAALAHGAPPPEALLRGRLGQGALDGSLLGRLGGSLGSDDPDAPPVGAGSGPGAGTLDKAIIRRVIRRQTHRVRDCYAEGLRLSPELSGKVVGRFEIRTDGSVGGVEVGGDLGDAAVERCIGEVLERMRFPEAGKPTRVSHPFVLQPG